ncbi:hypothetical protein JYU34_001700 [Plutella xylostella]|uniref:Uncharacterized protein n=1 Tax=Plutella xylostella TaxID=51655 RepID=A0ABQ7R4N0_PLUXY|nr:hypothetical protein JYU34_001700 [Plutella xylostella]
MNMPKPLLYGFTSKPLPMHKPSIFSLCRFNSANCFLAALNSLITLVIAAAPPAKLPTAESPANIGMSGRIPPVFGIGIMRGSFTDESFMDSLAAAIASSIAIFLHLGFSFCKCFLV